MADIIHFLKALLLLILSEIRGKEGSDKDLLDECNLMFNEMLDDAFSFCNKKNSQRSKELRMQLKN